MQRYYVWLTCMLESYTVSLIAHLIKKGYTVSALSSNPENIFLAVANSASGVMAIRVSQENKSESEIFTEVKEFMISNKYLFYSLIVAKAADCQWNVGNVTLPKRINTKLNKPKPNHLTLLKDKGPYHDPDKKEDEA